MKMARCDALWILFISSFVLKAAEAIFCYQCNSTQLQGQFQCGEFFDDSDIQPTSCDNVYGAKYCIKQTGHIEGITTATKNCFPFSACPRRYLILKGACLVFVGTLLVVAIKCYQCYAAFNISCTDVLIHDGGVQPMDCDHVFEAAYCVKTTGLYAGGVGTRRFCSSSDLGSYCNYVRQPGDVLPDYRSCFYTCDTDGCNSASFLAPTITAASIALLAHCLIS